MSRQQVLLGSCSESTPAVWNARRSVGTREGFVFGIGDQLGGSAEHCE